MLSGRSKRGVELIRKAHELDPLSKQLIDDVIWGSYAVEEYETCVEFSNQIRKIRLTCGSCK